MTAATMNPAVAPIALIFRVNDGLVLRALDGLTDEQFRTRPTDRSNSIGWITGHLVQIRTGALAVLGEPFETGWDHQFDRGAELSEPESYPGRDEIVEVAARVSERLQAHLAAVDPALLARPATRPLPGVQTLGDQLAFLALHDSYHVGQLAYIRKMLGHTRLVG